MKLAIYDFDGTYINVQTLPMLLKLWSKQKINQKARRKCQRIVYTRYLFHKLKLFGWDKQTFRANAMEVTADLFRSVEFNVLEKFLNDFYLEMLKYRNLRIVEQIKKDKKAGFFTVLLSGNFDIILKPFLKEGFDMVIGTHILSDKGLLSSKEVDIIIHNRKQEIILEHFPNADYKESKAYADSNYDLPILELVGHPVAVNPDPELLEIAKNKNFEIM
ncbi:haloacid dehalogenase-like hydrolase [Mycoplasmatota bacterium WC30]